MNRWLLAGPIAGHPLQCKRHIVYTFEVWFPLHAQCEKEGVMAWEDTTKMEQEIEMEAHCLPRFMEPPGI